MSVVIGRCHSSTRPVVCLALADIYRTFACIMPYVKV